MAQVARTLANYVLQKVSPDNEKHMFLLNMLRRSLQIPPLSFQKWLVTVEKCPFCTPAPGLFRHRSERFLNFSDCSVKRQAQLQDRGTVSAKVILIIFSNFFSAVDPDSLPFIRKTHVFFNARHFIEEIRPGWR